jgi:hypothetical protein
MAPVIGRDQTPVYAGRLEIRPADHAALVDGRPLVLTVRELQLLTELAHNAERVMTREEASATASRRWPDPDVEARASIPAAFTRFSHARHTRVTRSPRAIETLADIASGAGTPPTSRLDNGKRRPRNV